MNSEEQQATHENNSAGSEQRGRVHVSMVSNAFDTSTRHVDIHDVLETVRTGGKGLRSKIEAIRKKFRAELDAHGEVKRAKEAIDLAKKRLPAVMFSGMFTERNAEKTVAEKLIAHSGLLCADLDNLGCQLADVREKLSRSPYLYAMFLSPSGDGLKAPLRVPADESKHPASFRAVEQHIKELTGVQIDESRKDLAGLCYLSFDPELFYNPDAMEIEPLPEPDRGRRTNNGGAVNLSARQRVAVEMFGPIDWDSKRPGLISCPGEDLHTAGDSERDCRIYLDNVPTVHCFHNSCRGILDGVNHELRSRIAKLEYAGGGGNGHVGENAGGLDIKINVESQDLPRITQLAWDALLGANDPPKVFRHGSFASRIENDDHGYPIIREMRLDRMRHRLARVAFWFAKKKGKDGVERVVSTKPPMDVVRDVLATPDLPLPVLSHIAEAPIFARGGTLQTEPGYHPATQSYYAPAAGFIVQPISKQPNADDIKQAREFITDELLCDFPFTSNAERAHAVALLLLPFVRNMIDGYTPLHLIEKPSPGTGAGLLADVTSYVATGHTAPVMTEARDEDEWRKRITSKLRGGPSIVLIDNLSSRLDSAAVSAAITSLVWEDRILGHTENVRIPVRCAWVATGNNPVVSSEIARRVIRIRLDAKLDKPWERTGFRHKLPGWASEHRSEIVWSALTLVQAWLAAGRPDAKSSPTLGGFEDWSRVIGGILEVSEIPGFLKNLDEFYEASDEEGKAWRGFVSAWWERFDKEVGVSALFEVATALDDPLDLGDKSERSQKIRLGKLLALARDRQFTVMINKEPASLKIESAGTKDRASQWKLARIKGPDPWC